MSQNEDVVYSSVSDHEYEVKKEEEENPKDKHIENDYSEEEEKHAIEKKKKKKKATKKRVREDEAPIKKVPTDESGSRRVKRTKDAIFRIEGDELVVVTTVKTYRHKLYEQNESVVIDHIRRKFMKMDPPIPSLDYVRLAREFPSAYWNAVHFFKCSKNLSHLDDVLEKAGLNKRSIVVDGVAKRRSGRLRK